MGFLAQSLLFAECSAVAYTDVPEAKKLISSLGNVTLKRISGSGFVGFIFETDHDLIIAFRGLNVHSPDDLNEVFTFKMISVAYGGKVHSGFEKGLSYIWKLIESYVRSRLLTAPTKKIWLCGHSMGGAFGAMVLAEATRKPSDLTYAGLFTYGQPRCGNLAYGAGITTPYHRWVNYRDFVPFTPTKWWGYEHFGSEQYIGHDGEIEDNIGTPIGRFFSRLLDKLYRAGVRDHSITRYCSRLASLMKGT